MIDTAEYNLTNITEYLERVLSNKLLQQVIHRRILGKCIEISSLHFFYKKFVYFNTFC